jgi:hypothetical protein
MKAARSILLVPIISLVVLLSLSVSAPIAYGQAAHIRWDIITFTSASPPTLGDGFASALANDNSAITLTGSGTFVAPTDGSGSSRAVTGGGTWETFSGAGSTGSGIYKVTGLVRWEEAPGSLAGGTGTVDTLGSLEDTHAGLAVLRIEYSDGESGVLAVSCTLPGSPAGIFEGITASKGFVDYWNRVAPIGMDANRTLFHALR